MDAIRVDTIRLDISPNATVHVERREGWLDVQLGDFTRLNLGLPLHQARELADLLADALRLQAVKP